MAPPVLPTTAKSPLSPLTLIVGTGITGIAVTLHSRR
jgi:hypothetical protein